MRFGPTFRSVRMRPADGPSNGAATLSRIQSLADYTTAMLESNFRKRQGCALHQFFQRLAHSTWRAVGQAFLICLALGGCRATAQNDGPSREAFAEMVAFARLGSVACERLAPDAEGFHALALLTLVKPPLTKEEIAAQEKDLERLRERLGLRRWCQLYAGEMEQARILVDVLRRQN
jgi:hypothetical protein